MINRLQKGLAARRDELREGDAEKGFTLIELLVVVIIIGILAAIAIPVYIGVQNNSRNSAVVSDLTNAKTAVVAYMTDKQSWPDKTKLNTTDMATYGFTLGSNTTSIKYKNDTTPATSAADFCLIAVGKSSPVVTYYITANLGASTTAC